MRPRILHITASYKPAFVYGGPIYSIAKLCEHQALSNDVGVYTTNANGKGHLVVELGTWQMADGVRVKYFRRWIGDHIQFAPSLLIATWRDCKKYDVVHIHSWWNLTSVLSTFICILRGIKPVVSVRGTLSSHTLVYRHSGIKRLLHNIVGKRSLKASRLHVTSEKEAEECKLILEKPDLTIIPNLLQLPESRTDSEIRQQHLVFVGRINEVKNLEFLFEVLTDSRFNDWHLVIIGDGERDYVNTLKDRSSTISATVHWAGALHGQQKYREIAKSSALVLPSKTENFGNVVVEALSQGTPVVISDQVGARDFVSAHDLGWIAPLTKEAFSKVLTEVCQDLQKTSRIRKIAPQVIKSIFDHRKLHEQYMKMYGQNIVVNRSKAIV